MSGHSHWAGIKHKKELTDKKRGKIFSKIAKIIAIAARKGGDPEMNPALRLAIEKAKSANMPNDNIERAMKKGTGEDKTEQLEEILYEAFGPGRAALIIEVITDNKNRTLSELRHVLSQNNGRIGEAGTVKWMFDQKGVISIEYRVPIIKKEELELAAIDAGAEDIKWRPASLASLPASTLGGRSGPAGGDEILEVYTKPENLESTKNNLENSGIKIEDASLDWIPKNEMKIEDESLKKQLEKLFEALDENEDVNEIYSNVIL